MDNSYYLLIIIGMTIVTYIPRMFPLVILSDLELNSFWRRFLYYIPPAALMALIFPGILRATESSGIALAGGLMAVVLAFYKFNLLLIVLGAILAVFILQIAI